MKPYSDTNHAAFGTRPARRASHSGGVGAVQGKPHPCNIPPLPLRQECREAGGPMIDTRTIPPAMRRVRALIIASHAGPSLAITAMATLLAAQAAPRGLGPVLVAPAMLAGQLSVGWSNDAFDAPRDAVPGRDRHRGHRCRVVRRGRRGPDLNSSSQAPIDGGMYVPTLTLQP